MKFLVILILGAAALVAEDQVQFQPGVLAKIYACGAWSGKLLWNDYTDSSGLWPIKVLPDSPGEILRLKELPVVEATTLTQLRKNIAPSLLVNPKSAILRGQNFYAVEFEGYLIAPTEGIYTVVISCDDPYEVYMEGKLIVKSEWAADPKLGPVLSGDPFNPEQCRVPDGSENDVHLVGSTATKQASVQLSPNKFYHTLIVCRQRWIPATVLRYGTEWFTPDLNRGAVFRASLTTPDGKSGPLALQLPVIAKTAP